MQLFKNDSLIVSGLRLPTLKNKVKSFAVSAMVEYLEDKLGTSDFGLKEVNDTKAVFEAEEGTFYTFQELI